MSVELSPARYNRLPEAPYRDQRYIDISHWSQGERSRIITGSNPKTRCATNTFTTTPGDFGDGPLILLLPGTLIPASITFQEQIPLLERLGTKPALVDYSDSSFSPDLLNAQIADFIESPIAEDRKIYLIGVSKGAADAIDFLLAYPQLRRRITEGFYMGAVFSTEDLKPDPIYDALKRAKKAGLVHEATVKAVMPLVRKRIKVDHDPKYGLREPAIRDSMRAVSDRALSERIYSILDRGPIEERGVIDYPPAVFINWEIDESTPDRQEVIASTYKNHRRVVIPGKHGWTVSSAKHINSILANSLGSDSQRLSAVA